MTDRKIASNIAENIEQIQGMLDRIFTEANTLGVYLVDDSGFLIAEAGKIDIDQVALAALVAASFGANVEIARILGEKDFDRLTHQGENRNLHISRVGKSHILITAFDTETNLGLVKLYVDRAVIHLAAILDFDPHRLKLKSETDSFTSPLGTQELETAGEIEDKPEETGGDEVVTGVELEIGETSPEEETAGSEKDTVALEEELMEPSEEESIENLSEESAEKSEAADEEGNESDLQDSTVKPDSNVDNGNGLLTEFLKGDHKAATETNEMTEEETHDPSDVSGSAENAEVERKSQDDVEESEEDDNDVKKVKEDNNDGDAKDIPAWLDN